MKKLLTLTLAVLMMALPMLGLAEEVVVDELGLTLEIPVGYTAEYSWDEGTGMLGVAILPTAEGTPVAFTVFAQYSEELDGVNLSTMTDDAKSQLSANIASVISDPTYQTYTDPDSGLEFVSVASGDGTFVMVITIAQSTLMNFAVYDEAGVSSDDLTALESIINSMDFTGTAS